MRKNIRGVLCIAVSLIIYGCTQCGGGGHNNAMEHVMNLVNIGPHPSGSDAIIKAQDYIIDALKKIGLEVIEDNFIADTPIGRKQMKNIIGILHGTTREIIALGAHYETKYFTEFTFVGANDNCSGTGLLIEIARQLKESRFASDFTYWFVFLDGEECFVSWSESDSLYGSRHLVEKLRTSGDIYTMKVFLLLDMIGDKDLEICRERASTQWINDIIWDVAKKKGFTNYFKDCYKTVVDDHVSFLKAGISSVDIIDFCYGGTTSPGMYWHTPYDTLDKLSPQSLKIVQEVIFDSLPRIQMELKK
ncbi:MAG: M28 family peptidase [bacterium]